MRASLIVGRTDTGIEIYIGLPKGERESLIDLDVVPVEINSEMTAAAKDGMTLSDMLKIGDPDVPELSSIKVFMLPLTQTDATLIQFEMIFLMKHAIKPKEMMTMHNAEVISKEEQDDA